MQEEMTGKRFLELVAECEEKGVCPCTHPELAPYIWTDEEEPQDVA